MSIFIKTPFKCNTIENDPIAYGLRPDTIREAVGELLLLFLKLIYQTWCF